MFLNNRTDDLDGAVRLYGIPMLSYDHFIGRTQNERDAFLRYRTPRYYTRSYSFQSAENCRGMNVFNITKYFLLYIARRNASDVQKRYDNVIQIDL